MAGFLNWSPTVLRKAMNNKLLFDVVALAFLATCAALVFRLSTRRTALGWLAGMIVAGLPVISVIWIEMAGIGTDSTPLDAAVEYILNFFVIAYFLAGLFFLPTFVGAIRRVDGLLAVFILNLFGWSIAGWVAAVVRALGPSKAQAGTTRAQSGGSIVSPDGQFWWDGREWQPVLRPPPAGPSSR